MDNIKKYLSFHGYNDLSYNSLNVYIKELNNSQDFGIKVSLGDRVNLLDGMIFLDYVVSKGGLTKEDSLCITLFSMLKLVE